LNDLFIFTRLRTATAMSGMNQQPISLAGRAAGPHVLRDIPDPLGVASGGGEELLIVTRQVTEVDVYTGLAVKASIEQHLITGTSSTASPWLPSDDLARRRLFSLLGDLPARCTLADDHKETTDDPRILIPVTSIEDRDCAATLARTVYATASSPGRGPLRLGRREAYLLGEATAVLLDNALDYSSGSSCAPFIACAMDPDSRDVQLAVLDLGTGVSHSPEPLRQMRESLQTSRDKPGGIQGLIADGHRRDLSVSLAIRSGTAFARSRPGHGWETREVAFSPGWATGITVHPAQRN
jgi:hypothetical protein